MHTRFISKHLFLALALTVMAGGAALAQDIGVTVVGVAGQLGACRNTSSGQAVSTPLAGADMIDCGALGFTADPGDSVFVGVAGTTSPLEGPVVGGSVMGLDTEVALCRNLSTGQTVQIPLAGTTSWNCAAAGLAVAPGQRIAQLVRGTAEAVDGEPLPDCTINFDDGMCPDAGEVCGATFTGGNGCVIAGLLFCYDTGMFAYEVPPGGTVTIELSGDVNTLDVFFASAGPDAGTMTFFDEAGVQVDDPISTNGNCTVAMPASQALTFSRPVRSITVDAPASSPAYVDTFHVNP